MSADSSLDRFLRNRAAIGLGIIDKRLYSIQGMLGGLFSALGLSMVVSPLFGAPPDVAGGAMGILVAGAALAVSSLVLKRRYQHTNTTDFKLSIEAKGLLLKLVRRRLGWFDGGSIFFSPSGTPMMGKRTRRDLRHIAWDSSELGFGWSWQGKVSEVSPVVLELLDMAAEQYNRIQGILQTPSSASSTLGKVSAAALAAADEAMADILHDCAAIEKYPESVGAARKQVETAIGSLFELGDRLEEIATREQSITDKVDYASKIDSVLDELRLEQMARHELQGQQPDVQQRLSGNE